jgi:type II secretion system protein J
VESSYVWNSSNHVLEHYYQQPPDYESSTYQTQEILLEGLSDWRFSYWDGRAWQSAWDKTGQLPKSVKINFRFKDEQKEGEFVINIPVSP